MYLLDSPYRNMQLPTLALFSAMSVLVASAAAATGISTANGAQASYSDGKHSPVDSSLAMEVLDIDSQIFPAEEMPADVKAIASEPEGPLRPFNELMFSINISVDRYLLRPIAKTWATLAPNLLRQAIDNFFGNLELPYTISNQVLQGRFDDAGHNTARFVFNSTMGMAGAIDVGSAMLNLPEGKDADLGQSLAFWGVPRGPYIMLPFAGPVTLRNIPNLAASAAFDPLNYNIVDTGARIAITATEVVNKRSYLIGIDKILYDSINPYVLSRDLYLQARAKFIAEAVPATKSDGKSLDKVQDDEGFFDSIEQEQP